MRLAPSFASIALLLALAPSLAQAAGCDAAVTQSEMTRCEGDAFAGADARLNRVYAQVLKQVGDERVEALRAAQRAWVGFRERECAFAGSEFEGGSAQPMATSGCARSLTEERIKGLERYLR